MRQYSTSVLYRPETAEQRYLPEGPYSLGPNRLSWVSIQHGVAATCGAINVFDIRTGQNRSHTLPGRPGFAFPTDEPGTFVAGADRSVGLFDAETGSWNELIGGIDSHVAGTIINDGVCHDGNLIFGCKDVKFAEKKAGLYLWRSSDRELIRFRDDQLCSNGKAIVNSDGALRLLDIDTGTKTLVEYPLDIAGGRLGEPNIMLDLTSLDIFPDGMILSPDRESAIISFYNPHDAEAGETRQYSLATGEVETTWYCERAPQVTCPQLVQTDDGVKLVMTTCVENMTAERQEVHSNSGCLFIGDTPFDSLGDQPVYVVG